MPGTKIRKNVGKAGKKILVVESQESIRRSLWKILVQEGYDPMEARDGVDGLCKASAYKPDIIIMDLTLPRMDGIEAITRLRENEGTWDIPVVVLTGHVSEESFREAMEAGASAIMGKSRFKIDNFLELLDSFLSF